MMMGYNGGGSSKYPKMSKATDNIEAEFLDHKYRLEVVEECRKNLQQIEESLADVLSLQKLRQVALYFAKESLERCVEIYDYSLIASKAVNKYKSALRAVEVLLVLILVSNFITGCTTWLLLH